MANKEYTIFLQDGTCKCNLSAPALGPQPLPDEERSEVLVEGHYDNSVIYRNGEIISKPESNIILINSEATAETGTIRLTNIPNPTEVMITGNHTSFRRDVTDGEYEFSLDVVGEYTVKCDSKIELPVEFKVTIT